MSRVDTRILITFGCIVSASALFVMAGWDLGLDYGHAVRARMLQSFGLAFLFIPINVAAFAYVPRDKTNMGTGIINLARNMGASVGIATVTTMLQRRAQVHQAQTDGSREQLQPGVLEHVRRIADQAGVGGIERVACGLAGADDDLQHGAAAGRDDVVYRLFQIVGGRVFCSDSGDGDDEDGRDGPAGDVPVH